MLVGLGELVGHRAQVAPVQALSAVAPLAGLVTGMHVLVGSVLEKLQ